MSLEPGEPVAKASHWPSHDAAGAQFQVLEGLVSRVKAPVASCMRNRSLPPELLERTSTNDPLGSAGAGSTTGARVGTSVRTTVGAVVGSAVGDVGSAVGNTRGVTVAAAVWLAC